MGNDASFLYFTTIQDIYIYIYFLLPLIYLQHVVVSVTLSYVTHCSKVERVLVKVEEQKEGDTLK